MNYCAKFRGKEYPINLKKLRQLAEEYQERGYAINEAVDPGASAL